MSEYISHRRINRVNNEPQSDKLPDFDNIIKKANEPQFLKREAKISFIEPEKTKSNEQIQKPIQKSSTISKPAHINKALYEMEKAAEDKFNTFSNYIELRNLAGEDNDDVNEIVHNAEEVKRNRNDKDINNQRNKNDNFTPIMNGEPNEAGILSKGKKIKKQKTIKEKEMARRMKGQSSIATWKPDLFMKMRQDYDK